MPKYRITGPDGSVYDIDAPDDEAVSAAVSQLFGDQQPAAPAATTAAAPAPAAPQEESLVDKIMGGLSYAGGVADQGARGIADGAMNIIGMPVDLMNAGVGLALDAAGNPLGMRASETPFMGSKSLKNSLNAANNLTADVTGTARPNPTPDNIGERFAHRVGEEVGAAAVPTVGVMAKAGQVGVQGARQMSPIARAFVEPAAVNAGRFVGMETAAAAGAGTGAAIANEITRGAGMKEGDTGHLIGDLIGAITGGFGVGAARHIGNKGAEVVNALRGSPNYSDQVVRDTVTDQIAEAAGLRPAQPGGPVDTAPLVESIEQGKRVSDTIPGFQESLADRTKSPGVAALEYSRQSGPNSGMFTQRRAENTQAIDNAMARSEPQGNPGALRSEVELERDRRLADAEIMALNAQDAAARAVQPLQPQMTPQARGSTVRSGVDEALDRFLAEATASQREAASSADAALQALNPATDPAYRGNVVRSALEDSRDAARTRTEEAYGKANVAANQVDPTNLAQRLDGVTAGLTEVERGLVPQGVIDRVGALGRQADPAPVPTGVLGPDGQPITRPPEPPAPVTLKEATDLKSELLRLQRAALSDPRAERGGRNAARVLGQYIDAVDGFIAQNVSPEQAEAMKVARGAKFDEAEAFTRQGDPVAQALARYEGGQPRVRDERVASLFVNPASEQHLARLFSQANSPQVRAAIQDEILSNIPGGPTRANAEKLERFVQDYEIPLRQFPGLRDDLLGASTAQRNADAAAGAVDAKRAEFMGDSRALADTVARRSDGTPALLDEQVPGRFVSTAGNRDLDALFSRADSPQVRAAIQDEILGRAGGRTGDEGALRSFMQDYDQPLQRFPGLRVAIEKAAAARGTEAGALRAQSDLMREIGPQGRSVVAKYLQYGDENAEKAMRAVIGNKEPGKAADELLSFVGDDPKAVEGARKVFWDILRKDTRRAGETTADISGAQPWMPKALQRFVEDPRNAAVAERLYRDNPEHWENVKKITEAIQGVDLRNSAKAPNSSGTPQGMSQVLSPETLQSRFYAFKRGQISGSFLLTSIGAVTARRAVAKARADAVGRMLDEALLNPDAAAFLLKENNPANRAALARKAKTWLGNEASTFIELVTPESEDDEMKKAIMR